MSPGEPGVEAPFGRMLSPVEWMYAASQGWAPPLAIQLCVEGEGDVPPEALQAALAQAAASCPGASLVRRGRRWVSSGAAPAVRDLSAEAPPASFEALCAHPLVARPLDGPCAEVLLWRGTPTRLLFRVAHAAMDAQGCLQWVRQVFACLRSAAPEPHRDPTTDWDLFQALGRGRHDLRPFTAPSPFTGRGSLREPPLVRRLCLPPGQAGLVAKVAALLAARAPAPRLRVMVPIDTRRHRPALRACANLALPIFLDVARGEGWAEVQRRLLQAMQADEELASYAVPGIRALPLPLVSGLLRASGLACRVTGGYLASALVSHAGRVPLASLCAPSFQARVACSLPVHVPQLPLSVVMLESEQGAELTFSASLARAEAAELDALVARVAAELAPAGVQEGPSPPVLAGSRGGGLAGPQAAVLPGARDGVLPDPPDLVLEGPPSLVEGPAAAPFEGVWAAIAARAAQAPAAPAIGCAAGTVTYGALVARCEALAAGGHARGVRPGDRVAVVVERDAEALWALLAVLRLGATFVPIDGAQPAGRIARIVSESGARCCLVVSEASRAALTGLLPCDVVRVRDLPGAPEAPPAPPPAEAPDGVVYVMYTSGSTSAPKGVPISQRNLRSYVLWAREAYGVGAGTRFALISSLAFDLAITAWLLPLASGGAVQVMEEPLSAHGLQRFLATTPVNALKVTPAHLQLLADAAREQPLAVRLVVVGGSQLFVEDARRALGCFSAPCALYNEYGPTEATVGCVVHRFDPSGGADGGGVVPIGGPIAGMRLVLRHAPGAGEGVRELLLSGDGVASGYTSAGDEASAAFEHLPGGALAYRTGDLVRVLASGELAFWGRRGDALKVNGYRVDRPEVVEALRALPGVADAHVVVASAGGADTLTAYVTCRDEAPVAELRPLLLGQLPPYMVPHRFLRVPAIPLTANGKVDEAALGQLPHAVLGRPRVGAPLSGAEQRVAEVWRQVLGLPDEPLGAQAHFFELGGDSLAFLRMLTAVEAFLDGEPGRAALAARLRELLEDPTLGRLAALLEGLAPGFEAVRAAEGGRA